MTKIDLARRIVKLNEEVTGEPASDKAAEKLAARETTEALGKLLEDATKAAADKAGMGDEGEPAADSGGDLEDQLDAALEQGDVADRDTKPDNALAREAGRTQDQRLGLPDGVKVRVRCDGRVGVTRDHSFLTGWPARMRSLVHFEIPGMDSYDQLMDVADLERAPDDAPPAPKPDAWAAKPWLRPNVRVVLPALEPGESDEAPEGLPAERGSVLQIMGDAGTCLVVVDEKHRDGPEDDGQRTVSIDDVELAPEPTLAGANAADKATKHAVDVRRMERKLELARGRAKRAADEVARLEARLERLKGGGR